MSVFNPLRSIRSRLTAWYALFFLIVMLLLGAGVAYLLERELREDVDQRLNLTASAMSRQVEQAFRDIAFRVFLPPDAFTFPSQLVQVMDNSGRIRFRSENLGDRSIPFDMEALEAGREYYDTIELDGVTIRVHLTPIEVSGQPVGAVIAGEPLIQLTQTLDDLRRMFIFAAICGAVVAAIGGWFIAWRAFRSVDAMTSTARRIAATADDALPLETRLDTPRTGDEIARLGETFNNLLDRLQQSIDSQRRFVADASHELRTPLTAVQANVDLLERQLDREGNSSEATEETIADLRRESQRMTRLVTDLLTLARIDAVSQASFEFEPVSLALVARNAVRTAAALHPDTPYGVEAENDVTVLADPGRLEQVLVILLDNAALHSEHDSPVTVEIQPMGSQAKISVTDRGEGIPAKDLPHVFERFYRADSSRTPQRVGSGLGLAIAQAIVRAHNGTIGIASVEGEGTTVTIMLPVARTTERSSAD